MNDSRRQLGAWGEQVAAQYLMNLGYQIITRNFRCRVGEVDLIATERGDLVFIEVRTRGGQLRCGTPFDSVDRRKQFRLTQVALHYLARNPRMRGHNIRFDVVGIWTDREPPVVDLLRGAFVPVGGSA